MAAARGEGNGAARRGDWAGASEVARGARGWAGVAGPRGTGLVCKLVGVWAGAGWAGGCAGGLARVKWTIKAWRFGLDWF